MFNSQVDYAEVDALYSHFNDIAAHNRDDQLIDRRYVFPSSCINCPHTSIFSEFGISLGIPENSLFLDRLFRLFDEKNNGVIDFTQFIKGLSVLCTRGTLDEKIKFSFQIYDFDKDGKISKSELSSMLETSLKENGVAVTTAQIGHVVASTFKQVDVNKDGFIDYEEYRMLVSKHPSILDNMTLDFQRIIEQRLDTMNRGRKTIHHLKSQQEEESQNE